VRRKTAPWIVSTRSSVKFCKAASLVFKRPEPPINPSVIEDDIFVWLGQIFRIALVKRFDQNEKQHPFNIIGDTSFGYSISLVFVSFAGLVYLSSFSCGSCS
jgi:hypothetical protein